MEKLHIIGYGPGDETLLTEKTKNAIKTAQRILSTSRISSTNERIQGLSLTELMAELRNSTEEETAVLVSGDSGFFSAAKTIIKDFSSLYDIEVIPGIGSIQYLSAKIKIPYDDALLVSLHGRNGNIVPKVAYNKKVFVLTGGANSTREICRTLSLYGLGDVQVSIGERLSYPDERIINATAVELQDMQFDELTVVYIENPLAVNPHTPIFDSSFLRDEIPMTKEEIRWLSIQKLCISPTDIVYDIGAGTGSVSVEMARKAFDGFVYAIETKEEACTLVRKNIAKHGTFNIEIVDGEAPSALEGLPVPDKAFIGGSSGNMDGILQKLTSLNPGIKIVANAITLQTLNQIIEGFTQYGIIDTDTICVNIAKSKRTGPYDMMMAQNPVFIISGKGDSSHE
ncbi:MAG: precorrin-6y C5,15-methyltransferase (decarboxylating) subunit CbiE [Treponema sp.]|jgi:precorrin-6Y C5,15-methyltransferase (decarboxylating)|nr:precorrin-6y C5,15-methyltransferase (decarboxylating) subunit CbiE [Treponema sp.]